MCVCGVHVYVCVVCACGVCACVCVWCVCGMCVHVCVCVTYDSGGNADLQR